MNVAWRFTALLAFIAFFETADATISEWTVPVIAPKTGNGALTVQENQPTSDTIVTLAATSDGNVTYTLPTAVSPFAVAGTGELTISGALNYSTTPSYTLVVVATDDATPPDTGTATITITVNENVAPVFAPTSYSACVADGLTAGTSVYTVTATDQNTGDIISYSITGGDTNGDFSFSGSEIQVATGKTLNSTRTASYALQVEADDTALQATATVSVILGDCNTAATFAVSVLTLVLGLVGTLNSF